MNTNQSNNFNIQQQIQAAKKDRNAFDPLYRKYQKNILYYLYHQTKREQLAADLCTETFIKAMLKLNKFEYRSEQSFQNWLKSIAYHEMAGYFRKNKRNPTTNSKDLQAYNFFEEIEENNNEEDINKLAKVLPELSDYDQLLLQLRFFENKKYRIIAAQVNRTESAVKIRVRRTLQKIKTNHFRTA